MKAAITVKVPRWEQAAATLFVSRLLYPDRRAGPWETTQPYTPATIIGDQGARLAARHFHVAQPRGIVVLAHPDRRYGKTWFERTPWIDTLTSAGYDCLTFDFPAYGESRGRSPFLHEHIKAVVAHAHTTGLPVHVIGLSLGAFATANASPELDVASITLESPYPSFEAWYAANANGPTQFANRLFDRIFPHTSRRIRAIDNIKHARAPVLVAASTDDQVTPPELSAQVAGAAHVPLTLASGPHLHLIEDKTYRAAVLEHLARVAPLAQRP